MDAYVTLWVDLATKELVEITIDREKQSEVARDTRLPLTTACYSETDFGSAAREMAIDHVEMLIGAFPHLALIFRG